MDARTILEGSRYFGGFKGAMSEQSVLQQLIAIGLLPYYWSADNATAEIDFLISSQGKIIPIKVKAEENFKEFVEKYQKASYQYPRFTIQSQKIRMAYQPPVVWDSYADKPFEKVG